MSETGAPTLPAEEPPAAGPPSAPPTKKFKFPTAFTVLAIVLALVWTASFFVPAGTYNKDAGGSPARGTSPHLPSCSAVEAGGEALVVASPGESGVAPADGVSARGATAVPGSN